MSEDHARVVGIVLDDAGAIEKFVVEQEDHSTAEIALPSGMSPGLGTQTSWKFVPDVSPALAGGALHFGSLLDTEVTGLATEGDDWLVPPSPLFKDENDMWRVTAPGLYSFSPEVRVYDDSFAMPTAGSWHYNLSVFQDPENYWTMFYVRTTEQPLAIPGPTGGGYRTQFIVPVVDAEAQFIDIAFTATAPSAGAKVQYVELLVTKIA